MYRLGLVILILIVPLLAPAGCSPDVNITESKAAPIVRVRILENQDQATIASRGAPVFKSSSERTSRQLDLPRGTAAIFLAPDGWHVGNVLFPAGELVLQPAAPGAVSINGAAYHGRYRFVPAATPNRFDVVNDVDLDSYLVGVLPGELFSDWHIEAYKAQAIAARTYALFELRTTTSGHTFDLDSDTRSQMYVGIKGQTSKSALAVSQTAGVVLAYGPAGQEKIFRAYYSSCCGGAGQSGYDAFGYPDIAPLRAKVVGTLCSASSRFNWTMSLSKDELTRRIRAWGASRDRPEKNIGVVQRIDIAPGAVHAGRPVRFLVTDSKNLQYSMSSEELRVACNAAAPKGAPTLNSTFFTPVSTRDEIQFTNGHGWGHGVGMCQWCVQAMAKQGKAHEDIVLFSYPGAVLVRAY